ncbi:MAG: hypothetical protein ABWJ98_03425 [Hydrogenothermaceae bacterium]
MKKKFDLLDIYDESFDGSRVVYFDIGYGEKFVIFALPIGKDFDISLLKYRMPLEVLKESVRRFIEVKPPTGYRIRFLISFDKDDKYRPVVFHISGIGKDKILLVINLEEAGLGNEKVVINGLDSIFLLKIDRVLKDIGLKIGKIHKKDTLSLTDRIDVRILEFISYPNKFKGLLKEEFFDKKRRDFIVVFIFTFLKKIFR